MKRAALALLVLAACDRPTAPITESAPSPAASIFPSPLAPAETEATHAAPAKTNPAPANQTAKKTADPASSAPKAIPVTAEPSAAPPIRFDEVFEADALGAKETLGVALTAELRWPDAPGPPKATEVSNEGLAAARKLAAFRWDLTVTESGRLRVVFDSRSFPVPLGTELRARIDRTGHALVFPNGTDVRAVPPGTLRALFGDRRLDVVPLVAAEGAAKGSGSARFGLPTRRIDVTSRMGSVSLEVARVPEAGLGATLLCRLLVELVAVDPSTSACERDDLPLRATYTWPGGGGLVFDVLDLAKKPDFPVADVSMPPPGTTTAELRLPTEPAGAFLTREELAAFRSRPVEPIIATAGAPTEGILAKNATDGVRYLVLDGVAIGWFLPGGDQVILGPPRGHYVGQWRSFLGDGVEPARPLDVPVRFAAGEPAPTPLPAASASKPK